MPNHQNVKDKTVTALDIRLASAYYPILVDLARDKRCMTYGELVGSAKVMYADCSAVQKAIAVSTGRRLKVVRMFATEHGLPDITSLVINNNERECGIAYTREFDPQVARDAVFSFDWSVVKANFDGFVKATEMAITPRTKVKESQALEHMSDYYLEHQSSFPSSIRDCRYLIVKLIMEGFSAEEAFTQALENNDENSKCHTSA